MEEKERMNKKMWIAIIVSCLIVLAIVIVVNVVSRNNEEQERLAEEAIGVIDAESTEQSVIFEDISIVRKYIDENVSEHLLDDLELIIINDYIDADATREDGTEKVTTEPIVADFIVDELSKIYFPYTVNSFLLELSNGGLYSIDIAFDGSNSWAYVIRNVGSSTGGVVQVFAYIARGGLSDSEYKGLIDDVIKWAKSLGYGPFEFTVTDK